MSLINTFTPSNKELINLGENSARYLNGGISLEKVIKDVLERRGIKRYEQIVNAITGDLANPDLIQETIKEIINYYNSKNRQIAINYFSNMRSGLCELNIDGTEISLERASLKQLVPLIKNRRVLKILQGYLGQIPDEVWKLIEIKLFSPFIFQKLPDGKDKALRATHNRHTGDVRFSPSLTPFYRGVSEPTMDYARGAESPGEKPEVWSNRPPRRARTSPLRPASTRWCTRSRHSPRGSGRIRSPTSSRS